MLDSYIEDTPDLLRMFQDENDQGFQPPGSFPVTVDITALYTNVPTHGAIGGLQAFKKALQKRILDEKSKIPSMFLVELLKLVLDGNIFEFDNNLWHQQIGTAMGTKIAPTYANIFMGWLEETMLESWSNNKSGPNPYMWRRYIDDIFFLWRGTVKELKNFIAHLNSQLAHTHSMP